MNTNCLQGMRCPNVQCDQREGSFLIEVTTFMSISDSGTDGIDEAGRHLTWSQDAPVICENCGQEGTVSQFKDERFPPGTRVQVICDKIGGGDEWAIGLTGVVKEVDEDDYYEIFLDDKVVGSFQFAHYQLREIEKTDNPS